MGQSLIDRIQAKLELLRLEKRYTRDRHRRSTFVSNAVYVDGEYVFQTPNSTGSSTDSSGIDALHGEKASIKTSAAPSPSPSPSISSSSVSSAMATADRKRMNRFSSIAGFGGSNRNKELPRIVEHRRSAVFR